MERVLEHIGDRKIAGSGGERRVFRKGAFLGHGKKRGFSSLEEEPLVISLLQRARSDSKSLFGK